MGNKCCLARCQKIEEDINFNLKSKSSECFTRARALKGQMPTGSFFVSEHVVMFDKTATKIHQTPSLPPPPAKRNCRCFRVEGARSDFLLVRERDVPLRQIPCSLFEFVLGGLSHCEQPSVATHTIARVGWGLWGTAGWRAINIHGPGAHSLLYSSVKIQWRWHYFQRIKVGLFLLETVCSYVTALT